MGFFRKAQPNQPRDSISSRDSWEDDRYAESVYSEPRSAPPPPESTYSMPMSNRPPPGDYANIVANPRPDTPSSIKFDNGTGQLSSEILSEIRRTGKVPKNVHRTDHINAVIAGSRAGLSSRPHVHAVPSSRPQAYQAPQHQSITPSVAYAESHRSTTTHREKRYGNQDLPLAPAPLNISSRKKTAGAGVAGTHPPVPPMPHSKDNAFHPPRNEPLNAEFTVVPRSSPCVANGRQHPPPTSYRMQDPEGQHRAYARRNSEHEVLHTLTRPPTRQGRHIESSAARPSPRPAMPPQRRGRGSTAEEGMDEPTQASAVAAGRAMWSQMLSHQRPSTATERPVWVQLSRNGEPRWNGRESPIQGGFLRQGSVHGVSVKSKSVHDRAKAERRYLEKESRQSARTTGKAPANEESANGRGRANTYTHGKPSKSVVGSIKNSGWWWQRQGWRYGNGYWEKTKDGKKAKVEKKQQEVRQDEFGSPIETSGWYSDEESRR